MANLQSFFDALHQSCQRLGLEMSASKMQVLKQPPQGCGTDETILHLGENHLNKSRSLNTLEATLGMMTFWIRRYHRAFQMPPQPLGGSMTVAGDPMI